MQCFFLKHRSCFWLKPVTVGPSGHGNAEEKLMPILSKGSESMIDLHWYMLRFQYFKRFCYDTYVVQYSLGHCSLEVELKAAGNGHSERLERQNTQKKMVQLDSRWWVMVKVASVLGSFAHAGYHGIESCFWYS